MPDLEPSRSAPATTRTEPTRAPIGRARSSTAVSRLTRLFSAQHLDDVSNYHGGDHESQQTDDSDTLEQLRQEDYDEAQRHGHKEVEEVRMGIRDTRDLEANLEKMPSTSSIKDPNLVRGHSLL